MGLRNLFTKSHNPKAGANPLTTDIHSHFLPSIDDGSKSISDSLEMLRKMSDLGYKKVITTPHIIQDYYPNTPEIISTKLEELNKAILENHINIEIEAAAEYYLDEYFIETIEKNEELLTFGPNYLLFEMSFMAESPFLKDVIFILNTKGIKPLLAHVERYSYYNNDIDKVQDLVDRGCFIQMNINSIVGIYGKPVQKFAEKLIDKGLIHALGTDCHNLAHLDWIKNAQKSKYYQKALHLQLINHSV